jgi:hypothetical protein
MERDNMKKHNLNTCEREISGGLWVGLKKSVKVKGKQSGERELESGKSKQNLQVDVAKAKWQK